MPITFGSLHLGDWQTMEKIRAISRVAPPLWVKTKQRLIPTFFMALLSVWRSRSSVATRVCTLSFALLSSSSRPEAVEAAIRTFIEKSKSLSKSAYPDHLTSKKVSFCA